MLELQACTTTFLNYSVSHCTLEAHWVIFALKQVTPLGSGCVSFYKWLRLCFMHIYCTLSATEVLTGSRAGGTVQIVVWVYHIGFSEIWMLLTKAIRI